MINVSKEALAILNHSVGITEYNRTPNRGHFNVGESQGIDYERCAELESAGYMTRRDMGALGGLTFFATPSGKEFAVDQLPPPPVLTRSQKQFSEFMDADYGHSFAEWLGITMPEIRYESRYNVALRRNEYFYRYERYKYLGAGYTQHIAGGWARTKKEAKASYKAALKEARNK